MANLARSYSDQGQWEEAKELEVHFLEIRKQVLGPEHPNTLISMANLAYSDQRNKPAPKTYFLPISDRNAKSLVLI
jgi:hypothetical protein